MKRIVERNGHQKGTKEHKKGIRELNKSTKDDNKSSLKKEQQNNKTG
jgi:hypothetical protein